jgi:hypothetical protein
VVTRYRSIENEFHDARSDLLEAIGTARAQGLTLDRIAAIVGMSRQRVMQLLKQSG